MFVLAETIFFQCNLKKEKAKKNEKRCKKKHVDIKSAIMNKKKEKKINQRAIKN